MFISWKGLTSGHNGPLLGTALWLYEHTDGWQHKGVHFLAKLRFWYRIWGIGRAATLLKTLLQYYGKSFEALPGVAYPRVRDNRSTLNTKTGYEKNDSLVCFIIQVNTSMSFDSFIHSFVAICKVQYVEKVESEIILVDLHSSRLTRVTLDYWCTSLS